jgi:serine/threonine protein phosphatase PrpC
MRQGSIKTSPWKATALSRVGYGHEEAGLPCQDSVCVKTMGRILLMAVADGAGTARLGELGASIAASRSVDYLRDKILKGPQQLRVELLSSAVREARRSLASEARKLRCHLRDLHSTLIVILATPKAIAVAHVGDGAVLVRDKTDTWRTISSPHHGASATETVFVTDEHYEKHLRAVVQREAPLRIVAFSDGIESVALDRMKPFAPFLDSVSDGLAESDEGHAKLETLLGSDLIRSRTADDCTLAIACYKEGQS